MALDTILQAAGSILASLWAIASVTNRNKRTRADIRENLELIEELKKNDAFRDHSLTIAWLHGKVAVDVARLAKQPLGTRKKPIPWGTVIFSAVATASLSFWTYWIVKDEFRWFALIPGTFAFLMLTSIFGMVTSRELPPDEKSLPEGATPLPTKTAKEQIASQMAIASHGDLESAHLNSQQVAVTLAFIQAARLGDMRTVAKLSDTNWMLCRVQSWLWNNRTHFGTDVVALDVLARSLTEHHEPSDVWNDFLEIEARNFMSAWASKTPDKVGAASRRRIVSRELDFVVVADLPTNEGFYVERATALLNAMTFLVRNTGDGRWLVASHLSIAPPTPGWPPIWWDTSDPAMAAAVEGGDDEESVGEDRTG